VSTVAFAGLATHAVQGAAVVVLISDLEDLAVGARAASSKHTETRDVGVEMVGTRDRRRGGSRLGSGFGRWGRSRLGSRGGGRVRRRDVGRIVSTADSSIIGPCSLRSVAVAGMPTHAVQGPAAVALVANLEDLAVGARAAATKAARVGSLGGEHVGTRDGGWAWSRCGRSGGGSTISAADRRVP
jgi:hypothetical protein